MSKSNRTDRSAGSRLRPIERRDLDDLNPTGYDYLAVEDDPDYDEYGYAQNRGDRIRVWVERRLVQLGWVVLAAGLAFGSAGVAAATQHSPTSGNRPELTWAADQGLSVKLDAAVHDLVVINADVDGLGQTARTTLTSLVQVDQVTLAEAWASGSGAVTAIEARAAELSQKLSCDPWDSARELELSKTYSPAPIDRYHRICMALTSVAPLRGDWEALVAGSRTAMQVASDISNHDQIGATALQLATQGHYPEALAQLSRASTEIADATSVAAELANVIDVSTLQDWLTRTTRWDDAARVLWQSMIDSKGRITPQVTAALKAEGQARALLPDDNSVLQVVLDELAGNLIPDSISIETVKGAFSGALGELVGGTVFGGLGG